MYQGGNPGYNGRTSIQGVFTVSMQQQIEAKLAAALSPSHLEVINESYMHRVAPGSESHFKVIVVSEAFAGQRLLGRHRQVNGILAQELAGAIHALALHTYTEAEWQQREQAPKTPSCVSKPPLV
jgi:BolA family transcriptional regulator, general stress-responsive regulator